MKFTQKTFQGGLNTILLDSAIKEDSYSWGVNVRSRFGHIDPIPKHLLLDAPAGRKQGIIGVGNTLILFVAGNAYYRIEDDDVPTWILIPQFIMSTTAVRYWTCSVPASYMNFVRKLDTNRNIVADAVLTASFKVSGTPQAIVVQDGSNQPWLIIYDSVNQVFTARVAKNYLDWQNKSATQDDREYVPVGKQMIYLNGVLFIVASDGKSCYRSVTGRPLDFMINVDVNGNKLSSEAEGGARSTSFSFDFDTITCLKSINIPNSFVYATAYTTRILTMDYTNTIFGEPTFFRSAEIAAGVVNQNSFVDIRGDYAFVDKEGVISFNAVDQLQVNGRNSIFSLALARFLHGKKQTRSIAFNFNNYSLFNLDTTVGNIMAVYDQLTEKWISFDITDVIKIKDVAFIETTLESKVYCITSYNEVFEMFGNTDEVYLAQTRTRGHMVQESNVEHKSKFFRPVFRGGLAESRAEVIEYVDERFSQRVFQRLYMSQAGIEYPVRPPLIPDDRAQVDNPQYQLKDGLMGKKISFIIQWQSDAQLVEYHFESGEKTGGSSHKQGNSIIQSTYGI